MHRPSDRERVVGAIATQVQNEYNQEYRIVRPDGSIRWLRSCAFPIQNSVGEIWGSVGLSEYITECKQAEELLHQREREFRALVEHSPDLIFRFVRELPHPYVNPVVELVTGKPPLEFLEKTHRELGMPQALISFWEQTFRKVFQTGQRDEVEFSFLTPDGLKCFQTRLVPELAANGSIESVLGTSCDITKNKQTEEALRESEQRYRLLIEGMNEGVIVADENDSIWYVNEKFSEMLGYLPSELIGHNILKFLDEADRKIIREQRIRRRRGERGSYELGLRRNDGQKLFTLVSSIPFLGTDGSFKGRFAVVTDITALKVVESQLQQPKEQLRAVLDAVPGFIPWISSERRYLGANRHLAESFNLSPDNFVGKELGFLKNSPEFVQFMAQFLASAVPTDRQVVEIQINGSTRNYLVAAQKYNQGNVSVGIDITERIQADEALKAQSKYQVFYDKTGESLRMMGVTSGISAHKLAEAQIRESLQEKEVLLQEIHHRIKNNLQVISSLLNLQSQQIDDSAMLEVFWESCNRVKSMALVHEQLYQSKDCARINFSEYIQKLTTCLFRAYGMNADKLLYS